MIRVIAGLALIIHLNYILPMNRRFILVGLGLIVVGKVFLALAILSIEDLQKCLSIDRSLIEGPTSGLLCVDISMNYFVLAGIFLAAGAAVFVYGWRSKSWIKKYT